MVDKSLEKRHQAEEEFHDKKYGKDDSLPSHYKLQPTVKIYEDMQELVGDISGKKVLEYGCGDGWITVDLAAKGGIIDTFDISSTAVRRTQQALEKRGLATYCTIRKMSAEKLDYPDSSFDIVFGFAILHHLELGKAIAELYRVMKPSGVAIFAEPLGTNPLLNLYRRFTPQYRTEDEEPLTLKTFKNMVRDFSAIDHTEYYLFSLFPLALSNIKGMTGVATALFKILGNVDKIIFKLLPFLRSYAWYSIIVLRK